MAAAHQIKRKQKKKVTKERRKKKQHEPDWIFLLLRGWISMVVLRTFHIALLVTTTITLRFNSSKLKDTGEMKRRKMRVKKHTHTPKEIIAQNFKHKNGEKIRYAICTLVKIAFFQNFYMDFNNKQFFSAMLGYAYRNFLLFNKVCLFVVFFASICRQIWPFFLQNWSLIHRIFLRSYRLFSTAWRVSAWIKKNIFARFQTSKWSMGFKNLRFLSDFVFDSSFLLKKIIF